MSLFKKRSQTRKVQSSDVLVPPTTASALTPSWDLWYGKFKVVATSGNPRLQLQGSNENIIDYMDQQPLREAFERGVDATELGMQLAKEFDVGAFLRTNGIFK